MKTSSLSVAIMCTGVVVGGLSLSVTGCSPRENELMVARVGDEVISLPEYERMYKKSNTASPGDSSVSQEEREQFLGLLVKYRLKLKDAYRSGLDGEADVVREIEHYKGSLAQSFLTDREVMAPGVRRLYDRKKEEIRCSHILLELPVTATAEESTKAYALAYDLIGQLKQGADFGELALKYSKDPSVSANRGDLYYASGGDFVEPFETTVYSLKTGEIASQPVRTRFGLHVIKVIDRKPSPGQIRASHIMIRFPTMSPTPEDTMATLEKIRTIQDSLAMGVEFAALAQHNSDDGGSAVSGGDLGFFGRRRWIRPFDDTVMTMQPGQLSGIVRTSYGYHLIKCTDQKPPQPFQEVKQQLEQTYQQRRFQEDYSAYLSNLKSELRYQLLDSVVARFTAALDSGKTARDSGWDAGVSPRLRSTTILTILGRPVTVDSFITVLLLRPDLTNQPLRASHVSTIIEKVSEQLLYGAKAEPLAQENPEFRSILREYKEGILLYQIEQERIWSKITPTDSLLHLYFAAHHDKFRYPDRVRFSELRYTSEATARADRERLRTGSTFSQLALQDSLRMAQPSVFQVRFGRGSATLGRAVKKSLDSLAAQMKDDSALSVRLTVSPDTLTGKEKSMRLAQRRIEGIRTYLTKTHSFKEERVIPRLQPQPADSTSKKVRAERTDLMVADVVGRQPHVIGTVSQQVLDPATDERARRADSLTVGQVALPFFFKNGYAVVRLDGREPARLKTFEEAGPEISTAFQDYEAKRLEQEWIERLKKEFPVVERKDVLQSAFVSVR